MRPTPPPEAQRWAAFGRRLMLAFSVLTLLLGGGFTAFSVLRMRVLLEDSLARRGEAVAEAAARAAFVPLSLEDRPALARLASYYEGQSALAALRIVDDRGAEWARFARDGAAGDALIRVEAPIAVPGAPELPPIGRVVVRMDASGLRSALRRQVAAVLTVNGLFAAAILLAGLFLVRRLTQGMRELAREAARAEELGRSNRELEEFAYIASHDLQAPLRRISGFAQLLAERYRGRLDADADDYIGRIVASAERMQRMVQDLLTYSRAGSRELVPARADAGQVLRDVLADLETAVREAGADVSAGPLPVVTADPGQLARLFSNLVGNAIKFRAPGRPPRVRVEARRSGGEWLFSVADNGIGIEARYMGDIFKMFRRLHASSEYAGTGIGLAVARKIVERHGGRIWVESEPGRGSTFYFTLGAAAPGTEASHG